MRCPGQDTRYWKPDAIFEVKCPQCGHEVEFFKDEPTRKCNKCGHKLINPRMDFGCAAYCKFAQQCLGDLDLVAHRDELLINRVAIEMKHYFQNDFKRIGQTVKVARYTKKIINLEKGNLAVVLSAAYLHDLGLKGAEHKYHSTEAQYHEKEGSFRARAILIKLGASKDLIDEVVDIISRHHHPGPEESENFRVVYDADLIVTLEEQQKEKPVQRKRRKVMKVMRKIIEINEELCDGCGQCVPSCAEGAIQVIDGKAKLIDEKYCDGLGACLGECPRGALRITEREAEDFSAEAVEEYLHSNNRAEKSEEVVLACGCPSTNIESFGSTKLGQEAHDEAHNETNDKVKGTGTVSALSHWPVQIKLVPPSASFLKEADLLVLADCAAVAYPNLHRDFLEGKAVMMGCPKFDNREEYVHKFSAVFEKADIKRITVLIMEVPCCSGLPMIVEKGLAAAGKKIPVKKIVISNRGDILT